MIRRANYDCVTILRGKLIYGYFVFYVSAIRLQLAQLYGWACFYCGCRY
ncbi:MAG: hypothetical protein IIY09_03365 [Clostridia bacterium]|nr:hypothetical protein [Clostridia bacterium]